MSWYAHEMVVRERMCGIDFVWESRCHNELGRQESWKQNIFFLCLFYQFTLLIIFFFEEWVPWCRIEHRTLLDYEANFMYLHARMMKFLLCYQRMVVGIQGHATHEDIAEKIQERERKERCHKLARSFLILIFLLSVYGRDQSQPFYLVL